MPWLNSLKLNTKFVIMLFFPLAGLLLFGVQGILDKRAMVEQMESMQSLSKLAVLGSALVHETQKERGMTAGFMGSKGKKFRSELPKQRDNTDLRVQSVRNYLEQFDAKSFGTDLTAALGSAMDRLDGLDTLRNRVDGLAIPTKEAIGYYTSMNANFLAVVGTLAKLSSSVEMANMSTAYANFSQGKERAGIERAIVTNAFAKNQFGPGLYVVFAQLVAEQKSYFQGFHALALPEQIEFFRQKMQATAVTEVAQMRATAFKSGSAGPLYVALGKLHQNMALKGVYHTAKNLLIRGSLYGAQGGTPQQAVQEKYKKQFGQVFKTIQGVVEQIRTLPSNALNPDQRRDVETVWKNVVAYQQSIDAIIQL